MRLRPVTTRLVHPESLAATLEAVEEAFFHRRPLAGRLRVETAAWIAARQGGPGAYAGMFSPAPQDRGGVRVFTGEVVESGAATAHILGEEACRALILLKAPNPGIQEALARARVGMLTRLLDAEARGGTRGMYCCGKCSVAMWRHLLVGGLADPERRLVAGLRALKDHRTGDGKWRVFPFFYTLLALLEIDSPLARSELRYAAPMADRYLRRTPSGPYELRRQEVMRRVLARC